MVNESDAMMLSVEVASEAQVMGLLKKMLLNRNMKRSFDAISESSRAPTNDPTARLPFKWHETE